MTLPNPPNTGENKKARLTIRLALLLILFQGLVAILISLRAPRPVAPQIMVVAGINLLYIALLIAAIFMVRRGIIAWSGRLMVMGLAVASFILTFLIADTGIFLGLAITTTVFVIAQSTHPQKEIIQVITIGILVGFFVVIATQFPLPFQLSIPEVSGLFPYLFGLQTAAFSVIILTQFRNYSLNAKLILTFLVITLLPLGIVTTINIQISINRLTAEAQDTLYIAATEVASQLDEFITRTSSSLAVEANYTAIVNFLQLPVEERGDTLHLSNLNQTMNSLAMTDIFNIASYALLDLNGISLYDTQSFRIGDDESGTGHFQQAIENPNQTYVSPVLIDPETKNPSIYFSRIVKDGDNNPIGVLRARYHATVLQLIIENNAGLAGQDSFGVLFDEHHLHLAHSTNPETFLSGVVLLDPQTEYGLIQSNRLPSAINMRRIIILHTGEQYEINLILDLPKVEAGLNNAASQPFFEAEDVATGNRINQAAAIPMSSQPWTVVYFQPLDIFLAPIQTQTNASGLLFLATAAAVILAAFGMSNLLAAPITRLTEVAVEVASGNLAAVATSETEDEIGTLANTFNSMTEQLSKMIVDLEGQVNERTQALERRASQIQAAAEIARDATSVMDVNTLLIETVELVVDRFGYYHAGIFLIEERGEFAVLQAATGDAGRQMLEAGHKLKVGEVGIVGFVTKHGIPRITTDVGEDAVHFNNPYLPSTRSEMALPLKISNRLIGALDVQSDEPTAFAEDDITILQILADQLAVAINNAGLLEEVQTHITELQSASGTYTEEAWENFVQRGGQQFNYRFRGLEVEETDLQHPETQNAWRRGNRVIVSPENGGPESQTALAVPVKIRDQTVGVLNLRFDSDHIPHETITLVEEIANRMALVLENTRLIEESQRTAYRQMLIGEITNRMRSSLDMDSVLQTAVKEMQTVLNLAEVEVQIGSPQEPAPPGPNGNPPEIPASQEEPHAE